MKRLFVSLATCLAMLATAMVPASAREPDTPINVDSAVLERAALDRKEGEITSKISDYAALVADLEASPFPRESVVEDGQKLTVYTLPGITYTIAEPMLSTMITGGSNQYGVWVKFNNTEQKMIANGGGAALGVAICAIPGVGWALCATTSGIIAAALIYLEAEGYCQNNLLIYPFVPERNRCA